MIVQQFLRWMTDAPTERRADATSALARAYLYSDLSDDDRDAAEAAMMILLDDPSPTVRRALAEALARSPDAPREVILALVLQSHVWLLLGVIPALLGQCVGCWNCVRG